MSSWKIGLLASIVRFPHSPDDTVDAINFAAVSWTDEIPVPANKFNSTGSFDLFARRVDGDLWTFPADGLAFVGVDHSASPPSDAPRNFAPFAAASTISVANPSSNTPAAMASVASDD